MENIKYDLDNMDDQEIRDKISDLRNENKLKDAYNLALKARENDIEVDWALSWVLYSYLRNEKEKRISTVL